VPAPILAGSSDPDNGRRDDGAAVRHSARRGRATIASWPMIVHRRATPRPARPADTMPHG
jgi:hypothetical protein